MFELVGRISLIENLPPAEGSDRPRIALFVQQPKETHRVSMTPAQLSEFGGGIEVDGPKYRVQCRVRAYKDRLMIDFLGLSEEKPAAAAPAANGAQITAPAPQGAGAK